MKIAGVLMLILGLVLGAHALTMDVGIEVPAVNYGIGVEVPATKVANLDLMAQRQNYLIFAGILALTGAMLMGFGAMSAKNMQMSEEEKTVVQKDSVLPQNTKSYTPVSTVTICSKCRHMEAGDFDLCPKCGAVHA